MDMDISPTLTPKSDQVNADDLAFGPQLVTITAVTRGTAEQPVNIVTAEFGDGRPYKPCLSMRRVMVAAWGKNASAYVGRRMMLYRDPSVRYGGQETGGIRISAMSHIEDRLTVALTVTRGRRAPFTVEPLPEPAPEPEPPPAATPELVAEFERDITKASTLEELDEVAADLKSCELGAHRERLRGLWAQRRKELESGA